MNDKILKQVSDVEQMIVESIDESVSTAPTNDVSAFARRVPIEDALVSIVMPVYNEAEVLKRLVAAIDDSMQRCPSQYEIIFVNDGSSDASETILDELATTNPRVRVIHLSRNFGHQSAVHAGLSHANGDAVIVMDSDMQDKPSCLPNFIEQWQAGYDVVYAIRTKRKEGPIKRLLFYAFYRTLNAVSTTTIPNDAGIFSLMDKTVVRSIVRLRETDRFLPGLRNWVGFRQKGIVVERDERHDETPRVSMYQLFQLAKTALFSFSRVPLSSFYAIASVSVIVCVGCILFTLYHRLYTGLAIPGWASITIIGSFFGAVNSLGIGVLGEYVVRIYDQVRDRPKFLVARTVNYSIERVTVEPNAAAIDANTSEDSTRTRAGNRIPTALFGETSGSYFVTGVSGDAFTNE